MLQVRSKKKRVGDSENKQDREEGKSPMITALHAKFNQNEDLKQILLATGNKHLVECNKFDNTWGIGLPMDSPLAEDCITWKGQNLLETCLDEVRHVLPQQ
jgi:ribA/ribD-fused uncharacterized protein